MQVQILLFLIGLICGGMVAAGIFGFIVSIGIVQRMAVKTDTGSRMQQYETCLMAGGLAGAVVDLWLPGLPGLSGAWPFGVAGGALTIALGAAGVLYGIFIGALIMSLAETIQVMPVFMSRLSLRRGLPLIIGALAAGKAAGALLQLGRLLP